MSLALSRLNPVDVTLVSMCSNSGKRRNGRRQAHQARKNVGGRVTNLKDDETADAPPVTFNPTSVDEVNQSSGDSVFVSSSLTWQCRPSKRGRPSRPDSVALVTRRAQRRNEDRENWIGGARRPGSTQRTTRQQAQDKVMVAAKVLAEV
jgi:hypothetical protein